MEDVDGVWDYIVNRLKVVNIRRPKIIHISTPYGPREDWIKKYFIGIDMPPFTKEELVNRYSYHAPVGSQTERYGKIRANCLELAEMIVELTPTSREQSTALTNLDEVMFNSNAAIARNE